MLIFKKQKRQQKSGAGLIESLGNIANFLSTNKDTISNVANVVGNVASAGAKTAAAAKEIYDVVSARRLAKGKSLPKSLKKELTEKNKQLIEKLCED